MLVRKIDGYVMRTVGGAMFLVMMVVLSLDLIFAFIAELDDIRNNAPRASMSGAVFYMGHNRVL